MLDGTERYETLRGPRGQRVRQGRTPLKKVRKQAVVGLRRAKTRRDTNLTMLQTDIKVMKTLVETHLFQHTITVSVALDLAQCCLDRVHATVQLRQTLYTAPKLPFPSSPIISKSDLNREIVGFMMDSFSYDSQLEQELLVSPSSLP